MELSLVSFNENIITFQILLIESMKFIKFDYDLDNDTLEKVSKELFSEQILKSDSIDAFMQLLNAGVETAKNKREMGKIRDGLVELNPQEGEDIGVDFKITTNKSSNIIANDKEQSSNIRFGENTLEEMQHIEEEMKLLERKKEIERKREEEVTQRLKAKLEHKNANYELSDNNMNSQSTFHENGSEQVALENIQDSYNNTCVYLKPQDPNYQASELISNVNSYTFTGVNHNDNQLYSHAIADTVYASKVAPMVAPGMAESPSLLCNYEGQIIKKITSMLFSK